MLENIYEIEESHSFSKGTTRILTNNRYRSAGLNQEDIKRGSRLARHAH